jgi:hypothetical protein
MRGKAILAALPLLLAASTIAQAAGIGAAVAPGAGVYAAAIAVTSVSGPTCPNTTGAEFAGVVDWGGIASPTVTIRSPVAIAGLYALVSQQLLTIKRGLGTTKLSGTVKWTSAGIDSPFSKLAGTFNANLVYIDAGSFVVNLTENLAVISCSESAYVALTRVTGS